MIAPLIAPLIIGGGRGTSWSLSSQREMADGCLLFQSVSLVSRCDVNDLLLLAQAQEAVCTLVLPLPHAALRTLQRTRAGHAQGALQW